MGTLMIVVLLGTVGALAATEQCESEKYTLSGECCMECPPGEGVLEPCGVMQTVCTMCLDSETFSDSYSLTETCQPCTQCEGQMRMETPCTDTNDAVCVCNYGYYMNEVTGRCDPCTTCPLGHGMLVQCGHYSDTICEPCVDDTFSESESMLDPCLPCTICDSELEIETQPCSPNRDTVCHESGLGTFSPPPLVDLSFPIYTEAKLPEDGDSPSPTDTTTVSNPSSPRVIHHGLNENLIPIYCSILAAVVVGLVAFIVFKRWNSCKQNKQGAGNRSVSQTASAEGEKLHSDSGISVDSQSLQEHQQAQTPTQGLPQTVVMVDGGPGFALPSHKSEELERLLGGGRGNGTDDETDWRSLAGLLGYQEEHIAAFGQEERPVRALLSHWAGMDSASLEALCAALRKMDRGDIAQGLGFHADADPSATSAV